MLTTEMLQKALDSVGAYQYGVIRTKDIVYSEEVRKMCEANICRQYGKTWACPPGIGTLEECKIRCMKFNRMFVFSAKYCLDDSFDYEGMQKGHSDFKQICRKLDAKIKPYLGDYLILSNEGCDLCGQCTYPDHYCIHPDVMQGSIEGYGIFIDDIAKKANINYGNGNNTVTYFGAVLFNEIQ